MKKIITSIIGSFIVIVMMFALPMAVSGQYTQTTPTPVPPSPTPSSTNTPPRSTPSPMPIPVPGRQLTEKVSLDLREMNGSDVDGNASAKEYDNAYTIVTVKIDGVLKDSVNAARLYAGRCNALGAVKFALNPLKNGKSITQLQSPIDSFRPAPYALAVYDAVNTDRVIACGDTTHRSGMGAILSQFRLLGEKIIAQLDDARFFGIFGPGGKFVGRGDYQGKAPGATGLNPDILIQIHGYQVLMHTQTNMAFVPAGTTIDSIAVGDNLDLRGSIDSTKSSDGKVTLSFIRNRAGIDRLTESLKAQLDAARAQLNRLMR